MDTCQPFWIKAIYFPLQFQQEVAGGFFCRYTCAILFEKRDDIFLSYVLNDLCKG